MENEQSDFDPHDTHAEMAVLRLLVEALLNCVGDDALMDAVLGFKGACERMQAEMLATQASDRTLRSLDRAVVLQQKRLVGGGLAAPTLFDGQ